jgi:aspartyl-tRNA(Asn)/glutamyl-tRNA(Gln) amidotransferase subunit B
VPNEQAVAYTIKIAVALGCDISPSSIFHRKNYFYPDMPKNYQISQYDIPLGLKGVLEVTTDAGTRAVGITRVHLEEDTGKSLHMGAGGRIHDATYSLEDFNRAGTPLVEIVTEPDMTSPEEGRAFAQELRSILEYLGVSDVRLEEGSMRFDANISVAPPGERGAKVEVKNLNSLKSLHRALAYEEVRQREVLAGGGTIDQSTRHWDERSGVTRPLRTKEHAFDYRYFPEPDLVPIKPSPEWLEAITSGIPELPPARRRRFIAHYGLTPYDASVLVASGAAADYFEDAAAAAPDVEPKQVANWLANDLLGRLSERGEDLEATKVTPQALGALVSLVAGGAISGAQGKVVLDEMMVSGRAPGDIVEEKGLKQVSGRSELEAVVARVLAEHPDVVKRIRGGDAKPKGFLVGQIMKATRGQANPAVVQELLKEML